jgi:hypothetical protein
VISVPERKTLIEPEHKTLSVNRQLELLEALKSSYYRKASRKISRIAEDDRIKDEIMEMYEKYPFSDAGVFPVREKMSN